MPGFLMHANATVTCPHSGPIPFLPIPGRVTASANFVTADKTVLAVTGCPFTVPTPGGPKPQPCVTVEWKNVSGRVKLNGVAGILLQATPPTTPAGAMCYSAEHLPQGPPLVQLVQTRVIAS